MLANIYTHSQHVRLCVHSTVSHVPKCALLISLLPHFSEYWRCALRPDLLQNLSLYVEFTFDCCLFFMCSCRSGWTLLSLISFLFISSSAGDSLAVVYGVMQYCKSIRHMHVYISLFGIFFSRYLIGLYSTHCLTSQCRKLNGD